MNLINVKLFFRKTLKDRFYFIISTVGLSFGMAAVFFLFFLVMYEFNFDKFHKNYNDICLVSNEFEFSGGVVNHIMETPGPLASYLKENFPEIKNTTTCMKFFKDKYIIYNGQKLLEKGYAVNSDFFDIFSFKFTIGDKISSLASSNSIILSEKLAKKLFLDQNPIGKSVQIDDEGEYFVSGVIKDIPINSSLKIDFILPMTYIKNKYNDLEIWEVFGYTTFIVLDKNADVDIVNNKIKDVLSFIDFGEISKRLVLTPLSDFHFNTDFGLFVENPGDLKNTYVLILLAIFILVISIVNYVSLSIARSELRKKEIGVKQTFGVSKNTLVKQFFTESVFYICFISIISIFIIFLVIPKAQILTGKELIYSYIDYRHVFGIVGIIGIAACLAGLYPSFYLSSLKPLSSVQTYLSKRSIYFRKGLVLLQFVLVVFVSLCVYTIYNQVSFMMNKDLGYDKENLIRFNLNSDIGNHGEILNELLKYPDIKSATQSGNFINITMETGGWSWKGNTINNLSVFTLPVGNDFIETIEGEFIKGTGFSENEESKQKEVIINESAMKFMGIIDCIGMPIKLKEKEYKIVGVVNDFHYSHLKYPIKPLLLLYNENLARNMVRINGNAEMSLKHIEKVYNKFNTSIHPFKYDFVEDDIITLYGNENQMKKNIVGFLLVLLFISIISTIGMMASHISQKNKEIGIRKVFGAKRLHINIFLLKDIVKIIIYASIVSIPLAFLFLNRWLDGFANHIEIELIPYILISILFILLVILLLLYQSNKAFRIDPVKILNNAE